MAQANLSYLIRPYHKSKGKGRAGVNEGGGGEPAVGNSLHSPPRITCILEAQAHRMSTTDKISSK